MTGDHSRVVGGGSAVTRAGIGTATGLGLAPLATAPAAAAATTVAATAPGAPTFILLLDRALTSAQLAVRA